MLVAAVVLSGALTQSCALDPPTGMRCVAGGAVNVGTGEYARTAHLNEFFVDRDVVLAEHYAKCVKAGACTASMTNKAGVAHTTWVGADQYCAFAGKRLLQEAEWERALLTAPPSTAPLKPVVEWTSTWFATAKECPQPSVRVADKSHFGHLPPAVCGQNDALDVCDGAVLCGTYASRVTKSASDVTARSRAAPDGSFAGFRCKSDTAKLTRFPSKVYQSVRTAPALPTAPSEAERRAFLAVTPDTTPVPPCEKPGRSFIDCKDPRSYLKSNEPRLFVLTPYVKNLGGGYTGVGSDQNYTLVSHARSSWVWLFDYDENVVRWHHVLLSLIDQAETPQAFVALFEAQNRKTAVDAILRVDQRPGYWGQVFPGKELVALYQHSATNLHGHYLRQLGKGERAKDSWLSDLERYQYIRNLVKTGRIGAWQGNMLDEHAMKTIATAAQQLKIPMRIYYPSNAPEFWIFTPTYRSNVAAFPFDDQSIVVQTISGIGLKTGFGQTGYWHYNIMDAKAHVQRLQMPGYTRLKQLIAHRTKTDSTELTTCDLPEADGL